MAPSSIMNPQKIIFDIKNGDRFSFQFKQTKIISVSNRSTIKKYTGKDTAILKYSPQFPNGVLSLDFSDFDKIKTVGLFRNLNNGFDFIIHPRMWIPYIYENKKIENNPTYSLQYKIKTPEFDTICINCNNDEVWVEIYCNTIQGEELCIMLHDLHLFL